MITDSVKNESARTKKIEGVGIERFPQNHVICCDYINCPGRRGGALTGICPVRATKAFLTFKGGGSVILLGAELSHIYCFHSGPVLEDLESLQMGSYPPLILKSKLWFFDEKDFIKS